MWNVCMGDRGWLAQRDVDSGVGWQIVYTADDNNLTVNNQCSQFTQDILGSLVLVPDFACITHFYRVVSLHANLHIDTTHFPEKNDGTCRLHISMLPLMVSNLRVHAWYVTIT
jgi:hypothetical protein